MDTSQVQRILIEELVKEAKNLSEIVNKLRRQKAGSERELYEHFFSYGMSISLRYSANHAEAVEVLNDSFMKVFKKVKNKKVENLKTDSFKPWFRRIIINTATDYHRKSQRYEFIQSQKDWSETEISSEDIIIARLSYEDLLGLVQKLTPGYRSVFNLYAIDGYKHEEIADMLQISIGASKSNLSRARQVLREMLRTTFDFESSETAVQGAG